MDDKVQSIMALVAVFGGACRHNQNVRADQSWMEIESAIREAIAAPKVWREPLGKEEIFHHPVAGVWVATPGTAFAAGFRAAEIHYGIGTTCPSRADQPNQLKETK